MFLAHSFRLRDPWKCECAEDGAVCWSRVFHRPTGLEDDDALWLVCSGLPAGAAVTLNRQRLVPSSPGESASAGGSPPAPASAGVRPPGEPASAGGLRNQFNVTTLLADANTITIHIPPALAPHSSLLAPHRFPYDIRLGVIGRS